MNRLTESCLFACLVEDRYGCPSCNSDCQGEEGGKRWYFDHAVADSPVEGGMTCNCAENQVCLNTGRFGTPECANRKSDHLESVLAG